MKNKIIIILLSVLTAASAKADSNGYYLGISYLDTEAKFVDKTDGDSGLEARFGYIVNDYISAEAAFLDLGNWKVLNISDGGGSIETEGYGLSVLGTYPINDFKLIGKLGSLWWDSEGTLGSIAGPVSYSNNGSDLLWGLGLSYGINKKIDIKLEYNDSHRFNWSSLGLNYRF